MRAGTRKHKYDCDRNCEWKATPLQHTHTHTHEHGGRQVQQPKHGHALLHGREGQGSVGSNAPARTQRRQNDLRTAAAARGCLPRTATLPGLCVFWCFTDDRSCVGWVGAFLVVVSMLQRTHKPKALCKAAATAAAAVATRTRQPSMVPTKGWYNAATARRVEPLAKVLPLLYAPQGRVHGLCAWLAGGYNQPPAANDGRGRVSNNPKTP